VEYLAEVDPETYGPIFEELSSKRSKIVEEFKICQGDPVDLGGYYMSELYFGEAFVRKYEVNLCCCNSLWIMGH